MPLVSLKEALNEAQKNNYALGAFNCNNMEIVQAIVQAAEAEGAPVIIQASQGAIKYAGLDYITTMVKRSAEDVSVPVVLHLDHGTSFEQIMRCIRSGFTSVMIDGSQLPFRENIAITQKVVEAAGAVGVSVEGELGKIGGTEDDIEVSEAEAFKTNPEEARQFFQETGVDALAVAVGTAHGRYKGEPHIDFDRIKEIAGLIPTPLVLHGSSGVPDDSIRKAVQLGVCKVNIDTDIRETFVGAMRRVLAEYPDEIDPRKVLDPARSDAAEMMQHKIRVFGSSGQA